MSKTVSKDDGLDFVSDKYTYNKLSDSYIINLKCQSKPLVISGARHRAICRSYSQWGEDLTIDEIVRKYALTPEIFDEYRRIFHLTKTKEPLSIEEVLEHSIEDSVQKILEEKRYKIYQNYEKESWKQIQAEAMNWRNFRGRKLDPFVNFIEGFKVPKITPKTYKLEKIEHKKALIINLSDIHVGLSADPRYLYFQKKWNTKLLEQAMAEYADKLAALIAERTYRFEKAVICFGGDFLHTLTGFTDKGTKIENEILGEAQLEYGFTIAINFLSRMLELFPTVEVKAVSGNHDSVGDYVISRYCQAHFRNDKRMKFDITPKRFLPFKITKHNLFILEHGYSAKYKSKLPRSGAGRDSYIQNVFLGDPKLLQGVKNKYYITNDQHHMEVQERNGFEMLMCGSIVKGDRYSDNSMLHSRPRQSVFVVDESGMSEILHMFFDK